ncbi:dihydrofolate reductase family protein [Microbacterium sp. G2-8]|uniref:dihydrofolate reductase family protein n=1 Tax=Microbacterium sp. G2-8 TaxID=2842454 RepID=UPI001C8B0327|nr:dihydrofolate reductase family protein [Microbacterium sp. G2-8]
MRLIITQNVTLDGSIEMLDDWFDPVIDDGVDQSDLIAENRRQDAECDAVLLGRQTFTDFRGYWPHADPAGDPVGISDFLNGVQKHVVSGTLTDPEWENSTIVSQNPLGRIAALKRRPGRNLVVTGSITLCHHLIHAGLVDEYRLFTYPAVQGRGRRLFPDGYAIPSLRLLDAKHFARGITYTAHEPVPVEG